MTSTTATEAHWNPPDATWASIPSKVLGTLRHIAECFTQTCGQHVTAILALCMIIARENHGIRPGESPRVKSRMPKSMMTIKALDTNETQSPKEVLH